MTRTASRAQHSRISSAWQIATLLLAAASFPTPVEVAAQASPVRDADAKCARCHDKIYREYLNTPMANASGSAAENLRVGTYLHAPSRVQYSVSLRDGKAVLASRSERTSRLEDRSLSYSLGSGHLGTTYLYSIGSYLFESPVAWYAASLSYEMKPGLAEMRDAPPPLPMQSGCLRCHMSAVQASDPGTMNRYTGLPFLHSGITCEACHGDSRKHVLSQGKASIVNPARLDAERRDSVCISCHLEGDISVERAGHSTLDYRPGDSIAEFVAYYVKSGADLTARGVSEVEQLSQSTCKRISGDKMSCVSCHDPHFTPGAEHRASFFRGKCLVCHNDPSFAASHHPENQDCTSCHMHRTGAMNILHVAWTDHRILKLPADHSGTTPQSRARELVPIFSPKATGRDLAMAHYQALLAGDREYEDQAFKLLQQQRDSIQDDKDALDALGNLSAERGDLQGAEKLFRRVLELDSRDLTALSNLGIIQAKQGKLDDAVAMLRDAFRRNQDVPGLAMNLARVECMAGQGSAAQETLDTAMSFDPDAPNIRELVSQVSSCPRAGEK
jgi:tetratricopeptide (TPR) repeat protein